ncbi:unnamed protein product [Ambrosiozyma monospora]|uniref:Unnamed protein product n=1 Tax=Ambrosiozyma monospora TaxID=43982 RepID=A0A9W7DIH8_AMBMO|nr:unnamed protein product [Ambrosiozyma monospora]
MARPSSIYRSGQLSNPTRTKYKFPILDSEELLTLYDALNLEIPEEMLIKPTQSFMQTLVDQFIAMFLDISPHSMRQNYLQTANERLHSSLNAISPLRFMYKFLCDCGVDDFSINDIYRPEATRTRIILSAVMNYARFREERMADCNQIINSNEGTRLKNKEVLQQNEELREQLKSLTEQVSRAGKTIEEVLADNNKLSDDLHQLSLAQRSLGAEHERYKSDKSAFLKELESQQTLSEAAERELEKMRPFVKESPESVRDLIKKLKQSITDEEERLRNLENKVKKASVSIDSLRMLIQELSPAMKILDDLQAESTKNQNTIQNLKKMDDEMEEAQQDINSYTRTRTQLEKQLERNKERALKEKQFLEDKLAAINDKLEAQRAERAELQAKDNAEDIDLSSKEAQISWCNQQVTEMEKQYQNNCKVASIEMERLNLLLQRYVIELDRKLDEQNL